MFLDKLGDSCAKFNVKVRCYCMMPNHFQELSKLRSSFDFEEILKMASTVSRVSGQDILRRRSKYSLERKMFMYCTERYCRSRMSLTEMAAGMSVSQRGLTRSRIRFESEIASNECLMRKLTEIEKHLVNSGSVTP
jgi:hypothetical protein